VVGHCEHGNKPSVSIKGGEFLSSLEYLIVLSKLSYDLMRYRFVVLVVL
jgi:hypothetical protein